MAWGYSPRPVVRGRETSLGKEASKGPGFLLVLVGICACVFVFAIVSEVLSSSPPQQQEEVMIRLNGDIQEEQELLVKPDSKWEKGEGVMERKYRILWKKSKETRPETSSWERDQQEKRAQQERAERAASGEQGTFE